ncbi:hypothetical protein [Phenylobacterium sp.]|uniref:hypothetical protein n=1 Tax=Phenylobacterium sp. TaxID=1871053 RepID=UPI0035B0AB93
MTLLTAPLWLQLALVGEALALAWLTARFGRGGLLVGLAASLAFWFVLAFGAAFLVGRLEGGRAAGLDSALQGALAGAGRLALVAWPLLVAGAAAGAAVRLRAPQRAPRSR